MVGAGSWKLEEAPACTCSCAHAAQRLRLLYAQHAAEKSARRAGNQALSANTPSMPDNTAVELVLVQCSACRQVCNCGKECQGAHWTAAHKGQCRQFWKLSAVAAKQKDSWVGRSCRNRAPQRVTQQQARHAGAPENQRIDDYPRDDLGRKNGRVSRFLRGHICDICVVVFA